MNQPDGASVAVHKDYEGSKFGMWLFLFTEILLFGGLFILYSAYRAQYPNEFHDAGQHLNSVIGIANTIILLTSSLTLALSITAIRKGNSRITRLCLGATIVLGIIFLINKYVEWSGKSTTDCTPIRRYYPSGLRASRYFSDSITA